MSRPVSKAEFARLAGVSRQAISKACLGRLGDAMVGKRIDLDHKQAKIYLAGRDDGSTGDHSADENSPSVATKPRRKRPEKDDDTEEFLDLTLREIGDEFKSFTAFEDWLNARKKIVDIREKDLKNAELEGVLIPREGVRVHVFGAIDAAFERLVRDFPRSGAARAMAATRAGSSQEEVESILRDAISSVLKPLKQKAVRALREHR